MQEKSYPPQGATALLSRRKVHLRFLPRPKETNNLGQDRTHTYTLQRYAHCLVSHRNYQIKPKRRHVRINFDSMDTKKGWTEADDE